MNHELKLFIYLRYDNVQYFTIQQIVKLPKLYLPRKLKIAKFARQVSLLDWVPLAILHIELISRYTDQPITVPNATYGELYLLFLQVFPTVSMLV